MNQQLQTLIEEIYNAIKDGSIVNNGKLFSERELCEVFHVKRGVLQKALISLETLGIIDIHDRQGTFVVDNSSKKLLSDNLPFLSLHSPTLTYSQAMEARLVLEPKIAALAASMCTPLWAQALKDEVTYMENLNSNTTIDAKDKAEQAYHHNMIMHTMIAEITGNQILVNLYQYLSDVSHNIFAILGRSPAGFQPYALWPDLLIPEHKRIAEAIISGNPEEAELAMHTHLMNSLERNNSTIIARQI